MGINDHSQLSNTNSPLDILISIYSAAPSHIQSDVVQFLGRRMLFEKPIDIEIKHGKDDDPDYMVQSIWIDEQLYSLLPCQDELNSLDDAKYGVLESAWSEGFDEVVFDTGVHDDHFAEQLIEPYLNQANMFSLPLMTEFGSTEEEMLSYLKDAFKIMIVQWRRNVIDHFRKKPNP